MKLNLLSTKVETNTNIREYSIVLVVLVNTILVPNTRYIILLRNFYIKIAQLLRLLSVLPFTV